MHSSNSKKCGIFPVKKIFWRIYLHTCKHTWYHNYFTIKITFTEKNDFDKSSINIGNNLKNCHIKFERIKIMSEGDFDKKKIIIWDSR
jgi:hypothetical protein